MSQHSSRGPGWGALRRRVLERDGHLCVYCGAEGRSVQATHVDHVLPKARGGSDDLDNLVGSCRAHNLAKGSKLLAGKSRLNPRYFPVTR